MSFVCLANSRCNKWQIILNFLVKSSSHTAYIKDRQIHVYVRYMKISIYSPDYCHLRREIERAGWTDRWTDRQTDRQTDSEGKTDLVQQYILMDRCRAHKVPHFWQRVVFSPAPKRTWWWAAWRPGFSRSPWRRCQSCPDPAAYSQYNITSQYKYSRYINSCHIFD